MNRKALLCLLLAVSSSALAAEPTATHLLLSDIARIGADFDQLRKQATDNASLKAALNEELMSTDEQAGRLLAQRNELAAYCSGTYDKQEYEPRKRRCDVELPSVNAAIDELARKRAAIISRDGARATAARDLATRLEQLQRAGTDATTQSGAGARCGSASSPGWSPCIRAVVCDGVKDRAARSRRAVELLRRELATNQNELQFWTAMNAQAQKDALLAGARFVLGEYAAGGEEQVAKLKRLSREAEQIAAKAADAHTRAARAMYARKLYSLAEKMGRPSTDLLLRQGAKAALSVDQQWAVTRDTLKTEFALAHEQTAELKALLESPQFKDAFKTEELDTPGADLLGTLAEETGRLAGERLLTIAQYESAVAPSIRAAVFVRDSGYNATLSLLSTRRVLQQSDLAGQLAKASGVLQGQYADDVDDLTECNRP